MRILAVPFLGPCVAIGACLATGLEWLMALAIALGPGVGIVALTYLCLSTDATNEAPAEVIALPQHEQRLEQAA
jgi:hypothetical protein